MKKLVSSIIITCMLLMTFCSIGYAATFQPTIMAESGVVGDTITVTVSIPADTNAAGGSFNLVYDNTKMELVDAVAGSVISAFTKTVNKTYAENKVRLNFAGTETVSANGGVVLTATFVLTDAGIATFSTEKFKLADIDTNYLTCEDATESIVIEDVITTIAVTGVALDKTFAELTVGENMTLIATVLPENATNKNISWKSSNTNVATVSNGVVTAKAAGKTTITVTTEDGGYTEICNVTVKEDVVVGDAPKIITTGLRTLPGKEIEIPVTLENNTGFANLGIEIGYDSSVMTLVKVVPNSNVGGIFTPAQKYTANPYNMVWDSNTNNSYNGNLAILTFAVVEDAPEGVYPITVDYYKGRNGNYIDGDNINYDENFEAVGFVYVSGDIIIKHYVSGDINDDEIVDNKDATHLLRYLAGWDVEIVHKDVLDVDGNGKVDNRDATTLLRYLAGWDVKLH